MENAFGRILPANFTLILVIECNSDNNFVPYGKYDLPRSDRKLSPVFVRVLDGFLSPRDENSNGSQIERNKFEPNHKKYNATVEPSLVEPSLRGCFFGRWRSVQGSRKTVFQMPSFYLKVNEQSRKLPSPSFEQVSAYLSSKSLKNN